MIGLEEEEIGLEEDLIEEVGNGLVVGGVKVV